MTPLAFAGLLIIAVVVFLFVIEPVLRASGDETVIDTVALPQAIDPRDIDDETLELPEVREDDGSDTPDAAHEPPAVAARRVSNDLA